MRIFLLFVCLIFLRADVLISPQSLPQNIKDFLAKNFPKIEIGTVQKDEKSYEVYLANGIELEFDRDGSFRELESKHQPFDLGFLPENIQSIIFNEFAQKKAFEVEKKINYYKIKLANGRQVYIDFNGTILKRGF